jgi:hypothetical protein
MSRIPLKIAYIGGGSRAREMFNQSLRASRKDVPGWDLE